MGIAPVIGNTVMELNVNPLTTGGSMFFMYNGITSAAVLFNDTAANIQAALSTLYGTGNVTVAANSANDNYVITFGGALANTAVPQFIVNTTLLLSGSPVGATVTTLALGGGNESQQVVFGGSVSGGTYTLVFNGQTTVNIASNASPATVQADLEGLPGIGQGNVLVTGLTAGANADGFLVMFRNNLGGQNVPQLTVGSNSLLGTTPTVTTSIIQIGAGNDPQFITLSGTTSGTFTLTLNGQTTIPLSANISTPATAAQVQAALQGLPGVGANNVVVSGPAGGPYSVVFVGDLAFHGVQQITANTSQLNSGAAITPVTTSPGVFLGANAAESISLGSATGGTFILSFNGVPTSAINFNADGLAVQNALIAAVPSLAGNIAVSGTTSGGYTVVFLNALANRDEHLGFISGLTFSNTTQPLVISNLTVGGLGEAIQGTASSNTTANTVVNVLTLAVGQNQSAVVNTGVTTLSLDSLNNTTLASSTAGDVVVNARPRHSNRRQRRCDCRQPGHRFRVHRHRQGVHRQRHAGHHRLDDFGQY